MTHPLGVDGLVELAIVERSGLVESRHLGAAIVLGADGGERVLGDVDALIREQPGNAYFWELKGNMLYANGKYADAIPALRKSLQIAGREPLIEVALAQALLGMNTAGGVDEALGLLRRAVVSDPSNSLAYHQMANAFYKKQQYPQADLAAAQAHFIEGNVKQAQIFAKRALTKLPRGSPEWLRAEDIVNYKAPT